MCYQKAPFRACGITRTLLALLWSGKRHVNRPCLAGSSGSVFALVHLPCCTWAANSVILPPLTFLPLKHFFGSFDHYAACLTSVIWHQWAVSTQLLLKLGKRFQGFRVETQCQETDTGCQKEMHVFCIQNRFKVFCSRANLFVRAVTHLSGILIDWLILGPLMPFQQRETLQCIP